MKLKKNKKIFYILLIALLVDLIVPDPLVLVDEVGLIALNIWWYYKKIK